MKNSIVVKEYICWLESVKSQVRTARVRTALATNSEMICFYWKLGSIISNKLTETGWGGNVVNQLSADLQKEFPNIKGFSRRNLYYTKKFYELFSEILTVPQLEAQIEITGKCYVVVELKNTKFIPEYAEKLNFYLSAVDEVLKTRSENPTIGIMLCRDKNRIETEFALRGMSEPMGVSEFSFTEILPEELKGSMPTVEEIEREIGGLDA